ncbi:MAG: ribosome maturation factor RimM [Actinobacteria bacterium]|nr:ribosome maturation factor RimM [Actinomycetota bacterium]
MARLGQPHGLEGFLGLYVDPDDLSLFEVGAVVTVSGRPLTVRALRPGKHGPQVAFTEITDRAGAETIRHGSVMVDRARPLGPEDYWAADLVGLEVRPGGGWVTGVVTGAAQDRLVVERSGVTFDVPFVAALVTKVDLAGGYVVIEEIEGLIAPSG